MFNYENFLEGKLNKLSEYYPFKVEPERMFLENGIDDNVCYATVKYLASSVEFGYIKRQPINILILGRPSDDSIEELQNTINNFVSENNYTQQSSGNTVIKQEYMSPVVLDGFMEVGNTKRPVIYLSGTLFVMENVGDLDGLKINGIDVVPLSFNFNYVMQPNTQPNSTEYIAISQKSSASFSMALSIPVISDYMPIISKAFGISNGSVSGNENFVISFNANEIPFAYNVKLTSCQFTTAPNSVPTLLIGFMR